MPRIRQAILVLSVAVYAALSCSLLHAADKTAKSDSRDSHQKAASSLLNSIGKYGDIATQIWCPDDYRPKCPPCISPPTYCGRGDCYDAKCTPYICPPSYCGSCDCYDAKCPPYLRFSRCLPSFYKCPPPECCRVPAAAPDIEKEPAE